MILYLFAFVSGLLTIFAPCIWPLLPVILASSATGGKQKPMGIVLGIIVSFGLLTLFLSSIIKVLPFDTEILRYVAVFIIGFLGLSLLIPVLSSLLETQVSKLVSKINPGTKNGFDSDFLNGLITGLSLGVVWTPCAGPILGT
ncbi:MAG: cytochrome c biogenesis protein CcdA, partial [Patescibacteria group bacterium]